MPDTNANVHPHAIVVQSALVHELVLVAATATVVVTVDVVQTVVVLLPSRHATVLLAATVAHHVLDNSDQLVTAAHHVLARRQLQLQLQLRLQLLLDKLQVLAVHEIDEIRKIK